MNFRLSFFTIIFFVVPPFSFLGQTYVKSGIGTAASEPVYFSQISEKTYRGRDWNQAFRIESGYMFSNNFDIGVYGAYASISYVTEKSYEMNDDIITKISASYNSSDSFYYGIKIGYHFLPYLNKNKSFYRWDGYYMLCLGGGVDVQEDKYKYEKVNINFFEYSLCLGMIFKITEHWGVYGEYSFGLFYHKTYMRIHGGVIYLF